MPSRRITIDGREWQVFPSGFITQYTADEFGLLFVGQVDPTTVSTTGASNDAREGLRDAGREVRVTRYSPMATRSREQSLAELDDAALIALFRMSQPSDRSPEAGYQQ